MSCDKFVDPIGALVDGTIGPEAKRALDEHLASCVACRTMVADLRRIHEEAARLPRVEPPEALWTKVRGRLEAQVNRRGVAEWIGTVFAGLKPRATSGLDRPQTVLAGLKARPRYALAAAAILVLAVATGYVLLRERTGTPAAQPAGQTAQPQISAGRGNANDQEFVQSVEMELRLAEQHYEKAIAGLEQIANAEQSSLDPQVAAVLQKNLGIIDQAIRDSRVALQSQPTNQVAQASLFEAFRRKVALLQDTITLINEMRKGDQAGAAKALQNLNKG